MAAARQKFRAGIFLSEVIKLFCRFESFCSVPCQFFYGKPTSPDRDRRPLYQSFTELLDRDGIQCYIYIYIYIMLGVWVLGQGCECCDSVQVGTIAFCASVEGKLRRVSVKLRVIVKRGGLFYFNINFLSSSSWRYI